MSVNVRTPMRRRWALNLQKAISVGFGSVLLGGRDRNLFDIGGKSRPSIAPWIAQGAIVTSTVSLAMNVCVPQRSEGRIHRQALPSWRPSMRAGRIGFDERFIDKDTALRPGRSRWNTIPEPVLALFLYLGAATFGGGGCLFCTRSQACAGSARWHRGVVEHRLRHAGRRRVRAFVMAQSRSTRNNRWAASLPFPLGRPCGASAADPADRKATSGSGRGRKL